MSSLKSIEKELTGRYEYATLSGKIEIAKALAIIEIAKAFKKPEPEISVKIGKP